MLQFQLTRLLNLYDERCRKQIPVLLRDERRHVRYSLEHSLRELRRAPWETTKGFFRVLGYILRQDLIDLLKQVQTIGSGLLGFVLYFLVVTPYSLVLRLFGVTRRARLRRRSTGVGAPLDEPFWREP